MMKIYAYKIVGQIVEWRATKEKSENIKYLFSHITEWKKFYVEYHGHKFE